MGPWYTLTAKQSAVAACLLDGMTAEESAQAIGISTVAVRRHVEALYRKTGAGKRPQLVAELRKRAALHDPRPAAVEAGLKLDPFVEPAA